MRKKTAARKFLTILSLLVFLGVSYIVASGVTARSAEAGAATTSCGGPCILTNGLSGAIGTVSASVTSAITSATSAISAAMSTAMASFSAIVSEKVLEITASLIDAVQSVWNLNLNPAMKDMGSQLTIITADQSRAIGSFADAANLIRVREKFREERIRGHLEQRPGESVCVAGTVTGGLTRAASLLRAYNAAAPAEHAGRSGNKVGTPGATGSGAAVKADFQNYINRYCNADGNNGASGCSENAPFAGQDLNVGGVIFSKDTIDMTDADTKRTVDDMIARLAEPFVKDPVVAGAVDSAPGQQQILAGEAYKAKRQLVYDSLYHVVSKRIPGSKMGDFVRPLRLEAGINSSQISPNPSHNEIMHAMMSERFRSGRYAQKMIDEPENSKRESVVQQAFQLMQMSDQLDLMDRYSLLLAAQVGAEIRKSKSFSNAAEGAPQR